MRKAKVREEVGKGGRSLDEILHSGSHRKEENEQA